MIELWKVSRFKLVAAQSKASAFSDTQNYKYLFILMSTTIHFSGLNTEPAPLIHLASDFHSGLPFWLCPQTSLLTCWLNFS